MLTGPFLGLALPLLPAQILWINPLTHGPVGVAMGGERRRPTCCVDRAGTQPRACSTRRWSST
jgi:Ca2+-transporting ATPase